MTSELSSRGRMPRCDRWSTLLIAAASLLVGCGDDPATPSEAVASIQIVDADFLLYVGPGGGGSRSLQAIVLGNQGSTLNSDVATWTTRSPTVATVDRTGRVLAMGLGTTVIVASAENARDSAQVIVAPVPVDHVTVLLGRRALYSGATTTLQVLAFDSAGNQLSGRLQEVQASDTTVARVETGGTSVRALTEGAATIVATVEGIPAEAGFEVLPVAELLGYAPDSVAVILRSYPLDPRAILTNGDTVGVPVASLTSSDSTVAAPTATGVRALREGIVTIGLEVVGVSRSRDVHVLAYEDKPVPQELAAVDPGATHRIRVIDIRVLPTRDGVRLDSLASPDHWSLGGSSLAQMEYRIHQNLVRTKYALEEGSRFRGYASESPPSITLEVVRSVTYYRVPPAAEQFLMSGAYPSYFVDFAQLFDELGVLDDIDREQVGQVWFTYGSWAGGTPSIQTPPPGFDPTTARTVSESAMSSPSNLCVSNSFYADCQNLPRAGHTYVMYGYNPLRGWSCAVHNHGHQFERIYGHVDRDDIFWSRFATFGRAGHTHSPPNTSVGYDYRNRTLVNSDIEDWRPTGGTASPVNSDTWERAGYRYPDDDNCGGTWLTYWMQSFPGRDNEITLDGRALENWWDIYADWDSWVAQQRTLVVQPAAPAGPALSTHATPFDSQAHDARVIPPGIDYPPPERRR